MGLHLAPSRPEPALLLGPRGRDRAGKIACGGRRHVVPAERARGGPGRGCGHAARAMAFRGAEPGTVAEALRRNVERPARRGLRKRLPRRLARPPGAWENRALAALERGLRPAASR